jgi:hypothetical protein
VVLYEDFFSSARGLSGGQVTSHQLYLMSYPWAQSGSPYRTQSIIEYEAVAVAKLAFCQRPEAQRPKAVWYSGLRP